MKKLRLKVLIVAGSISFALFFLSFFVNQNVYSLTERRDIFRYLSDASIITGVLFTCVFCLTISSNKGAFDGLSYSANFVVGQLIPSSSSHERIEKGYSQYKMNKENNRKSIIFEFGVIGLFHILVSLVYYLIYVMN